MGKHFVLDYGCIVVNENIVNGDGRKLGNQDTSEGIGYGRVDVDEGEGGFIG